MFVCICAGVGAFYKPTSMIKLAVVAEASKGWQS